MMSEMNEILFFDDYPGRIIFSQKECLIHVRIKSVRKNYIRMMFRNCYEMTLILSKNYKNKINPYYAEMINSSYVEEHSLIYYISIKNKVITNISIVYNPRTGEYFQKPSIFENCIIKKFVEHLYEY